MLARLLAPSVGTIRVVEQPVRGNPGIYRQIGMASEHEQLYGNLLGREFHAYERHPAENTESCPGN